MISNITRDIKRLVIIVLVISMLLSIASCNKTNAGKKDKKVSADSPWYNGEIIDVDLGLDPQRTIEDMFPKLAGADDAIIVIFADGDYKVNDWNEVKNNSDFAVKNISVIDRGTKQLKKTFDLYSILDPTDWPETVLYIDGELIVKSESWDSTTNTYYKRDYYIDLETETIIDTLVYELDNNLQYSGSYSIGEYRIETMLCFGREKKHCPLKVYLPNRSVIDIDVAVPGEDVYEVPVVLAIDNDTALIPAAMERSYKFFKLDLATVNLSEVNSKDYEWLDVDRLLHSFNGSDGNVYFSTQRGISKINMENKTVESCFDFSCCGVNRNYLKNLEIADCSEDSFLLCGQYSSSDMFTSRFVQKYAIVEFTKADKNPHAGKTIIELYVSDGKIDETLSDAVISFNNTNKKYYIEFSDRYNRRDYFSSGNISSLDEYDSAWLDAESKLSSDLAIDIMNGEGPDILLNTSALGQLNNDNYLIDLSPCVTDLDSNEYFTNIIDGAKTNEKLYQLPICFSIEGIQTDPKYAGETNVGFTPEEYKIFLSETLNGKDVIESGQALYFTKLFNGMSDAFIKDGKVDLSGKEFAELSEYVKDNVQQNSLSWDVIQEDDVTSMDFTTVGNRTAYYCNCPGISGYLVKRAQINNGTAILGIPSTDGRGPMFRAKISVAVSANSVNEEACVEFVKILLSNEIQNELAMSDNLTINRDAFRQGCRAAIDYFNTEEGVQNLFDYAAGTYVTSHMKFTDDDTDNLEKVILSCSKMDSPDSSINIILAEEMPAYFSGQKNLSEVVAIMQDRIQKVLDER